jgi:hypothetical protein
MLLEIVLPILDGLLLLLIPMILGNFLVHILQILLNLLRSHLSSPFSRRFLGRSDPDSSGTAARRRTRQFHVPRRIPSKARFGIKATKGPHLNGAFPNHVPLTSTHGGGIPVRGVARLGLEDELGFQRFDAMLAEMPNRGGEFLGAVGCHISVRAC